MEEQLVSDLALDFEELWGRVLCGCGSRGPGHTKCVAWENVQELRQGPTQGDFQGISMAIALLALPNVMQTSLQPTLTRRSREGNSGRHS